MDKIEEEIYISFLADIYGNLITKRQLDILRDYYDYDYSLAEIAEKHGIARQSVKDSLKAAKESLIGYENKLRIKEKKDRINGYINLLLNEKGNAPANAEILGEIKKILENFTE